MTMMDDKNGNILKNHHTFIRLQKGHCPFLLGKRAVANKHEKIAELRGNE